jgi:hypothetical protein
VSSHYLHRYYRGVLLPNISYALGVPQRHHKETCSILHDAFKEYFCIGSTAELSDHTFLTYMSAILMIMARERGTLVPFFNESDDIQDMSMRNWITLQRIIIDK